MGTRSSTIAPISSIKSLSVEQQFFINLSTFQYILETKPQLPIQSIRVAILVQSKIHPVHCPASNNGHEWTKNEGKLRTRHAFITRSPCNLSASHCFQLEKFPEHAVVCLIRQYPVNPSSKHLEMNILHPQPPLARCATSATGIYSESGFY